MTFHKQTCTNPQGLEFGGDCPCEHCQDVWANTAHMYLTQPAFDEESDPWPPAGGLVLPPVERY